MEKILSNVIYKIYPHARKTTKVRKGIGDLIGLDTEADTSGRCFMIGLSDGRVMLPEEFPEGLFTRNYRDRHFVCYNLKYDEGALLRRLPLEVLERLRETSEADHEGYHYRVFSGKALIVRKGHHNIFIWDMYKFYEHSLEYNARKYLGRSKLKSPVKEYTEEFIIKHWTEIAEYCVNDAILVRDLGLKLLETFREFGLIPEKLYSTAFISYQHFRRTCNYVGVRRFWEEDRRVLDFAMRSYAGGKFETILRGPGDFYEYDITSAYPHEISRLVDITHSKTVWGQKYRPSAVYGIYDCKISIPASLPSPVPVKLRAVNIYPAGQFRKTIIKSEYDYLTANGADVEIIDSVQFHVDRKIYPYRREILRLVKLKKLYKETGEELKYHMVKILLNSLYGKMVQLIETPSGWKAGPSWNPIYAGIITANVRVRLTELQRQYPEIVAVHTDSVITTAPLAIPTGKELGSWYFETSGRGVIAGTGIYQIGDKTRLRGFQSNINLFELFDAPGKILQLADTRAKSWREVVFHGWDPAEINRFTTEVKNLNVNFDRKRLWLSDYKNFRDLLTSVSDSVPYTLAGSILI